MADQETPVVVVPKPAEHSSVIRHNTRMAWASGLLVGLSSLFEILLVVAKEPAAAALIASWFPYEARAAVSLIIPIAIKAISDRKKTAAPIVGSELAEALPTVPQFMSMNE